MKPREIILVSFLSVILLVGVVFIALNPVEVAGFLSGQASALVEATTDTENVEPAALEAAQQADDVVNGAKLLFIGAMMSLSMFLVLYIGLVVVTNSS